MLSFKDRRRLLCQMQRRLMSTAMRDGNLIDRHAENFARQRRAYERKRIALTCDLDAPAEEGAVEHRRLVEERLGLVFRISPC